MKLEKIEKDTYYHIFNRGIDGTSIFKNEENKIYFLKLFQKYLSGKVSLLAYCLMQNHYHFLVEINTDEKEVIQGFSNLFNAYAKAFNKQENRTGSLFEKHFKRKVINDKAYLTNLFCYIHNNPKTNKEKEANSSFKFYLNNTQPDFFQLDKKMAMTLFDSTENMKLVTNQKSGADEESLGLDLQGGSRKSEQHPAGQDERSSPNEQQDMNEKITTPAGFKPNVGCKEQFVTYIRNLQNTITSRLEEIDGTTKFKEDNWKRPEGGGGRTRVIENGAVFEKGGVNISEVHGKLPESMQKYFGVEDADFFACGLSLVLHPVNPMAPTVHANWRYFEMYNQKGEIVDQWFGGGQDLTPYYLFEEDAIHFHKNCKIACDKHNPAFYPKYKDRCDEYFYNAHREEGRGIGGLFFDYCKVSEEMTMQNWFNFVTEVGDSFLDAYCPIIEKRKDMLFSENQKNWQEIRRGRYVEFNLVHDKGTLFGLRTNGRIESILMSLPPKVQWVYDHHPEAGSEEEKLIEVLKNPKEWI